MPEWSSVMRVCCQAFPSTLDISVGLGLSPESIQNRCSCRSYGQRTETSGEVQVSFDADAVKGRHCVMVDDLCDSGLTLLTVRDKVLAAGAASVKSIVLLDKKARRKVRHCDCIVAAAAVERVCMSV
eukprot:GHUV01031340.1.p1 GENE.GHUV01031340.1~~GHUV01031340.1.p1  ORF type:complete len:140 (+),score=23.42 GHUV01031340.1:42-422(+)